MDFRVLGHLEVEDDGRAVALGPKQRGLVAILLVHRGEVVPADRLIEDLYGRHPPRSAAKSLQAHVSRLRKALGDGFRLQTASGGYMLDVPHGNLDLDRFEAFVDRGRRAYAVGDPSTASAAFREALALWRGPAFADFRYADFAQAEIARLEERRLAILEDRIDADLALGNHVDLVGELEAIVANHPLRERPRGQLMTALYRSGRQAEALDVYTETRRVLTEELGLEPGEELTQLQRAILEHDASLAAPRRVAIPLWSDEDGGPRGSSVFVGRAGELGQLQGGLDDALAARGRIFLLVGEPGIGKSRLGEEVISRASERGAVAVVGRCWEAGGAPAYWPWVQALRAYVRRAEVEALRAQLGAGASDIAQIIPELRDLFPDLPEPPALESEGARFRLFDSIATFLRNATRVAPLVLAFDDLHAADEPSLLLLRFVAREIGDMRILVLGTYRDVDPTVRDPLRGTLAALGREAVTRRIRLTGLAQPDIARFIELSTDVAPRDELVARILAETEGNPLFVTELVRLLDSEGHLTPDTTGQVGLPEGIREVIGSRVDRLSIPCQDVLRVAAVLGREFALDALARVSELPRDELLDVLDEAMTERVIAEVPGTSGRLRFAHVLIRDTLYDELPGARRIRLHREAGEALEHIYAADLDPHLAEVALHFVASAPAGTRDTAIDYARRAGHRAVSLLAFEEAARLYELALTLVEDDADRCDLLLALGETQARAGETPRANESFREAAALAEKLGLSKQLARAALGYGGRLIWEASRDDEHHIPLLERALEALGEDDNVLRVRLLARLAGGPLRDASFLPERRAAASSEALEMARRIGDPATLAYALHGHLEGVLLSPDRARERLEVSAELVEAALAAGEAEPEIEGREERFLTLLGLGDRRAADAELAATERLAKELRQPAQTWMVTVHRALLALLEGRLSEAEELVSEARRVGERTQGWNVAVTYGLQLFVLRRAQGRLSEIEELIRESADRYPTYVIWRCVRVAGAADLGEEALVRAELEALGEDHFGRVPFDEEWLVGLSFLSEAAATLGDRIRAGSLYQLLLPFEDRVAVSYPEISIGSVARYLGLLATTLERWGDAERHFQAALEMNERIGARLWLAHTQHDYAAMLLTRGSPAYRRRARQLQLAASALADEIGMRLPTPRRLQRSL